MKLQDFTVSLIILLCAGLNEFATAKPVAGIDALDDFTVRSHTGALYESNHQGLTITVPGSENCQPAETGSAW